MFTNNLKIAWRHLLKNKFISFVNLTGLVVGMTAVLFIWQYVAFEKSYDNFHENADRIFRIRTDRVKDGVTFMQFAGGAACAAPVIKKNFSEVEDYVKLYGSQDAIYSTEDKATFQLKKVYYAMPSIFTMFSFPMVKGDPKTSLAEPFTACLSESTAKMMFGQADPIGKTITRNGSDQYKITGVFKDSPKNSHLKFNLLLSYITYTDVFVDGNDAETAPYWDGFYSYIMLKPQADWKNLEKKFPRVMEKTYDKKASEEVLFYLQPLKDIHLTSNYLFETELPGDGNAVRFLLIIGCLVLIIAWFNYINMATARSQLRAKEVGVRKVLGSTKKTLISQFLTEAALINIIAIICSFSLAQILRPWFMDLIGKEMPFTIFSNTSLLLGILSIFFIGTLLIGFYPAFLLSSFKPITALKSGVNSNKAGGANWLRRGLVVVQFIASAGLIASTIIVFNQLQFMQETKLGVDIDQTLIVKGPIVRDSIRATKANVFNREVEKLSAVESVSCSSSIPGQPFGWTAGIQLWGKENAHEGFHAIAVDHNYTDAYQMEFVAGRPMSKEMGADQNTCILNERGVQQFKLGTPKDALGVDVDFWGERLKIIGVVKNFHQESPKSIVEPMIMKLRAENSAAAYHSIKLKTKDLSSTITSISATWAELFPDNPINYFFLDEHFDKQYASDQLFGRVFALFSGLAIFVSCLGLFALIAFMAERKKKEIGIRKVLGANVMNIVGLLSKDFFKLVLLALFIAIPFSWYFMNSWLDNFANRIDIQWWVFGIAGIVSVGIAFITMSFQSIKAALANPTESLKSE